jgi:hypothetical protein
MRKTWNRRLTIIGARRGELTAALSNHHLTRSTNWCFSQDEIWPGDHRFSEWRSCDLRDDQTTLNLFAGGSQGELLCLYVIWLRRQTVSHRSTGSPKTCLGSCHINSVTAVKEEVNPIAWPSPFAQPFKMWCPPLPTCLPLMCLTVYPLAFVSRGNARYSICTWGRWKCPAYCRHIRWDHECSVNLSHFCLQISHHAVYHRFTRDLSAASNKRWAATLIG